MIKKGILVFILATGVLSCFCDDVEPFWGVNDFNIIYVADDGTWVNSDTLNQDTINMVIEFELNYLSEVSFSSFFASTAMATSCPDNGEEGMKDPISNITLTCDDNYNGFTAGESLNSIVRHDDEVGFQKFIDEVETFPAVSLFSFRVIEKPTNLDSLKFNVELDFQSGAKIKKESDFIFWR